MDTEHPYSPPASDVDGPAAGFTNDGDSGVTPRMVEALTKTRPWVLFMGIVSLIGSGFMVLAGLAMLVIGGLAPAEIPGGGAAIGLMYLVMAALYVYPGIRLIRYAGAIKRIGTGKTSAIEDALVHQAAFWRFAGICMIAVFGIYILVIVGVVIFGVMYAS